MSIDTIPSILRMRIAEKFQYRCAYCLTAERFIGSLHTIDHIIPRSLGGKNTLDNLCLACWGCNLHKHARISAIDPDTGLLVRLFHPNQQPWHEHFAWEERGLLVVGLTVIGRATVETLQLNRLPLVESRQMWIAAGWHPPVN